MTKVNTSAAKKLRKMNNAVNHKNPLQEAASDQLLAKLYLACGRISIIVTKFPIIWYNQCEFICNNMCDHL